MSIKRYTNGVWTDIEDLKRYSSGACTGCSSAKKYSNGAWAEIWPDNRLMMKYRWVSAIGTTTTDPTYTLTKNGREAVLRHNFTNSPGGRSEVVLGVNYEADAGSIINFQYRISDIQGDWYGLGNASASSSIVSNISNDSGLYETVLSRHPGGDSLFNDYIEVPSGGITYINLVFQQYGGGTGYYQLKISDVAINGQPVYFSGTVDDTESDVGLYEKNVRYSHVFTTGNTNPGYTYSARGTYADIKLIQKDPGYRAEIGLTARINASSSYEIPISFKISNMVESTSNSTGTQYNFCINFSDGELGGDLWETMDTEYKMQNGTYTYSLKPSKSISNINFIMQMHGSSGDYVSWRMSDVYIGGFPYTFI